MSIDPQVRTRVVAALEHTEPDRVPVYDTLDNLGVYNHFAPGEDDWSKQAVIACHELGIDLTYGCMLPPVEEAHQNEKNGPHAAGMTWWQPAPPWRTLDDLRAWEAERYDEKQMEAAFVEGIQTQIERYEPRTMFIPQSGHFDFVLGYDTGTVTLFAEALYEAPELLERIWDFQVERTIQRNMWFANHKLGPAVQICEDIAYNGSLMFSPAMLDEYFFPRLQRTIRPLKEAGVKTIFHSDGDISEILPELIEIGIDGINPIDVAGGMNLSELKRKYGDKLVLTGGLDGSWVLPFGSVKEVREAVKECIRVAAPGGGYLIQDSSGEVMPDVPLENALAYFEAVQQFGQYPIDLD